MAENGGGPRAAHGHIRVPSWRLTWLSHPRLAARPPRGRHPRPPGPLPSGRGRPGSLRQLPPARLRPASPFPRPGAAPHGHKGRAGQERRDAARNAALEPDTFVGGGGGNPRLAGTKMLSRSALAVDHNDCPIPISGEKLTWNRPFFKPRVYAVLSGKRRWLGDRPCLQEPLSSLPALQNYSPLKSSPDKILHAESRCFRVSVTMNALPFYKAFLV